MESTSKILFVDWRHIQCGSLDWRTSQGETLGVANPPEPPVPLSAYPQRVPHGIRLAAQPASTTDPVGGWKGWDRTIYHDGSYRSWHFEINGYTQLGTGAAAHAGERKSIYICGVESTDGYDWREVSRSPVKLAGQRGFDGVTFFIDPEAPPEERYKFIYSAGFPEDEHVEMVREYLDGLGLGWDDRPSIGMFAAVSPDGRQWTSVNQPFMFHHSDTDTTVLWDEALGKYVMYTRLFKEDRRLIGRAEARDFWNWGPVEAVVRPRLDQPPDYDFYLNGYTRYPGLPEYQLMFPMVYQRYTERSDVRLYSSADGIAWNPVPGGPVIEPGPAGRWDSEFLGTGKDLVPFDGDKVAIPYSGTPYPHKYPRWQEVWDSWQTAWAWWPRDRICAVQADSEGEFWTFPLSPGGRELRINCRTPMAGEVRVGIDGAEGRSIEDCDPIVGDCTAAPVRWRGQSDIGVADGDPVTLHIKLRAAQIFAIEWV